MTDFHSKAGFTVSKPPEEKEPLLLPWKDYKGERGGYRNAWSILFGLVKHTLIHCLLFGIFSIVFMLGWHKFPDLLFAIAFIPFALFMADTVYIYSSRKKWTPHSIGLCMCGFSILTGSIAGVQIHCTKLIDYWPYNEKRHYTNVSPDEKASSHADASVLVFMEGARPDSSRSSQYKRYYHTYCVAPIALEAGYSQDMTVSSNIQYWAVGKDCCGGAEGFNCADAQKPSARTGLVMVRRKEEDQVLQGVLASEDSSYYEKAVLMTESKFDLTSPEDRIYVAFVEDIGEARWQLWSSAWLSWFKYQCLFFIIWLGISVLTIFIGTGDPDDHNRYGDHMIDAKQGVLHGLNHYI